MPKTVPLHVCESCGDVIFRAGDRKRISAAIKEFRAKAMLNLAIEALSSLESKGYSLRQIGEHCRLTPTYLYHVRNETKVPGDTLVALLRDLAIEPSLIGLPIQSSKSTSIIRSHSLQVTDWILAMDNFQPSWLASQAEAEVVDESKFVIEVERPRTKMMFSYPVPVGQA